MAMVSTYPEIVAACIRARYNVDAVRDLGCDGRVHRWRVEPADCRTFLIEFTESAQRAAFVDLRVWLDIVDEHNREGSTDLPATYHVTPAGVFLGEVLLGRKALAVLGR